MSVRLLEEIFLKGLEHTVLTVARGRGQLQQSLGWVWYIFFPACFCRPRAPALRARRQSLMSDPELPRANSEEFTDT